MKQGIYLDRYIAPGSFLFLGSAADLVAIASHELPLLEGFSFIRLTDSFVCFLFGDTDMTMAHTTEEVLKKPKGELSLSVPSLPACAKS